MDPTLFSEGFTARDITNSQGFTLTADADFMRPKVFDNEDDLPDYDEDDCEVVMKNVAASTEKHMLAAPKYRSFDDLVTKMTDVDTNGAVKILIMEQGSGPLVPIDAYVSLHYAAYWENEEIPFDNTLAWNNAQPVRHKMGTMIAGLEVGLAAVRGPTAQFHLLLKPEAMYGKLGALPRIRPERALYCVTLTGVEDIGLLTNFPSLPLAEQRKFSVTVQTVEASNTHAKTLFTKKKYAEAIKNYHMSLEVMNLSQPQSEDEMNTLKDLMCKVYTNLAVCYSKMGRPKKVVMMCDNITRLSPVERNPKALYLYGKAHAMLGEYEDALRFLKMALKLQPNNPDITTEMAMVDKKITDAKTQEKSLWKGAFTEKSEELEFNVSEQFKEDTKTLLQDLSEREGFIEYPLPPKMRSDEVGYTKKLLESFKELSLKEDDLRSGKKYTVIKKQ